MCIPSQSPVVPVARRRRGSRPSSSSRRLSQSQGQEHGVRHVGASTELSALYELLRAWAPYGGVPAEVIFVRYGMSMERFHNFLLEHGIIGTAGRSSKDRPATNSG